MSRLIINKIFIRGHDLLKRCMDVEAQGSADREALGGPRRPHPELSMQMRYMQIASQLASELAAIEDAASRCEFEFRVILSCCMKEKRFLIKIRLDLNSDPIEDRVDDRD
ncbi:hypothetical protein EVAR_63325_1 [Eumeta japonica]|uniref:Uncharacterized protein n=1 Tax=Eumeta variegata TaxID=151549 RepID=A0A4C1YLG1_EUMVA|nr:hypothetical protein EVAR_63325_1 [Eumeta japonica]